MYRTLVTERARRPLHAGDVEAADGIGSGANPLCGDRVSVGLRYDPSGRIVVLRHRTDGCAICAAAADLMVESAIGLDAAGVHALWHRFEDLLERGAEKLEDADRQALGLLNAFADLHEYRSRRKCAALPWSALRAALQTSEEP